MHNAQNKSHVLNTWLQSTRRRIQFDPNNNSHMRAYLAYNSVGTKTADKWVDELLEVEYLFIYDPVYPSLDTQIREMIATCKMQEVLGDATLPNRYQILAGMLPADILQGAKSDRVVAVIDDNAFSPVVKRIHSNTASATLKLAKPKCNTAV